MVKLRVKLGKITQTVDLNDNASSGIDTLTLRSLKHEIEETTFQNALRGRSFEISLNGKDALVGEDSTLKQLGLVSGDLVRIICSDVSLPSGGAEAVAKSTNEQQVSSPSSQHQSSQPSCSKDDNPNSGPDVAGASNDQSISTSEKAEEEQPFTDPDAVHDIRARVYLNEPMLVRESTSSSVPQNLTHVYSSSAATNQHDALCVVMHVLMLETGFQHSIGALSMPDGWRKSSGVYKIQYTVPDADGATVTLTYVTLGSVANVFCTASGSEIKHQHKFEAADYVKTPSEKACDTFRNLQRLSNIFKDKVSYPVLQSVRRGTEAPVLNVNNLPWEVQLQILKELSSQDLLHLAAVSRHFGTIFREKVLWRRLYMRDFGRRANNNDINQDWYKLYKEKYVLRAQMRENYRRMRSEMLPPPFRDPYADPYPLHPGSNYPPGFVGGDYDRDPAFGGAPGLFGRGGGTMPLMMPRPRYDPIGPYPGSRDPLRPPRPGFGPRLPGNRRDPGFGGGGFGGFM